MLRAKLLGNQSAPLTLVWRRFGARSLSSAANDVPPSTSSSTPTTVQSQSGEAAPSEITSSFVVKKKMRPQDRPKKHVWYYAVRKGREIGVFKGWDETKGKVMGFSGAVCKPFKDEQRAKRWLEKDVSEIDPKDLPLPKRELREKDELKPSSYVLDFGTVISTSAESGKKGLIGMGWILRKFPERTLVVAGCDMYDIKPWKSAHPTRPGYNPRLARELPMLEALNRGLEEVKRVFKLEGTDAAKLPYPLHLRCDHVYTSGLLSGANPTIPELVEPLQQAKSRISALASTHEVIELPEKATDLAQGLAKAALARKFPKCTLEGGNTIASYSNLLRLITSAPDVPAGVTPAAPPPYKPLEVNGEKVTFPKNEAKA